MVEDPLTASTLEPYNYMSGESEAQRGLTWTQATQQRLIPTRLSGPASTEGREVQDSLSVQQSHASSHRCKTPLPKSLRLS